MGLSYRIARALSGKGTGEAGHLLEVASVCSAERWADSQVFGVREKTWGFGVDVERAVRCLHKLL